MFAGRQAGRAFHKKAACAWRHEMTRFLSVAVGSSMLEAEGRRRGELGWDRARHLLEDTEPGFKAMTP